MDGRKDNSEAGTARLQHHGRAPESPRRKRTAPRSTRRPRLRNSMPVDESVCAEDINGERRWLRTTRKPTMVLTAALAARAPPQHMPSLARQPRRGNVATPDSSHGPRCCVSAISGSGRVRTKMRWLPGRDTFRAGLRVRSDCRMAFVSCSSLRNQVIPIRGRPTRLDRRRATSLKPRAPECLSSSRDRYRRLPQELAVHPGWLLSRHALPATA